MTSTPREIGTLIVVVLRANHLPNKRHIGKQDPYCLVTVNGEKRRTKAIKRGGQHPEWDEEIRFTLFEDVEDVLARTARGTGTPPAPPPKDDKKVKKIKGGKTMKVACYADDPREPDLIGEVEVDLTEVLTKGETDEWFTLTNKDKFAGKVYLELTFWSNEPPPEKKITPKPPKNNKQYGGPGSFVPLGDQPISEQSRISGTATVIPSSLRASSSAANLDLYVPPYERNKNAPLDKLAQEFSEFGVSSQSRRRETFPPVPDSYSQQSQSGFVHPNLTTYSSYTYEQGVQDLASSYTYDNPVSPNIQGSGHPHQPASNPSHGYPPQTYHPSYEIGSSGFQPQARGPRHSVPTASSGFMPLSHSSGFGTIPSHVSEPSGFSIPLSHTPAPMNYNSQFQHQPQPVYSSSPHTPAPSNNGHHIHASTSLSFQPQQSFSTSPSYNYSPYSIPPSASAPPQQFVSSQTTVSAQANSAPPMLYGGTSPSHEIPPLPVQQNNQIPQMNGQPSRPLPPQPQVIYTQQPIQQQQQPSQPQIVQQQLQPPADQQAPPQQQQLNQSNQPPITTSHSLPAAGGQNHHAFGIAHSSNMYPAAANYAAVPPPPPPPIQYQAGAAIVSSNSAQLPIPPPPPPPPPNLQSQPRRRASLPQPPVTYQQPVYKQQIPPPPPPPPAPVEYYSPASLPPPPPPPPLRDSSVNSQASTFYPGHPPKPPAPVDEYGQWAQTTNPTYSGQQTSQAY
ncbi:Ingression protein fic1 [Psilocybe cubensis]|uniref:C2 domain-containing protein n=2 Tax=Psilocybe cubensis TaxID=181762 RepID=A0A8H7Y1D8_PSICU|nr:Ingression protein fic1 [Psilocybe cubensis]KAH9482869.1 Ingression protein fic1 [Psilocybe cubensis]